MAITKRQKLFADKVQSGKTYSLEQALDIIKTCATAKFKESVDLSINLGIDAKKSDQNVRGSTTLPHGNGKTVRVAVFAQGAKAQEAKDAGVVIASPDTMRVVGSLGQVLGPRGLMPNPKTGTVTPNVAEAVRNAKSGQARYRTDKAGIVHCAIGAADFEKGKLQDNLLAVLRDVRRQKPATSKGVFIRKVVLSTTMGPGVPVDLSSLPE